MFFADAINTPRAEYLAGAFTADQLRQTDFKFALRDTPIELVKEWTVSQGNEHIKLVNDADLSFRPFDDEGKLRSRTVVGAKMVEASEHKNDTYGQLQARIRHPSGYEYMRDEKGDIVKYPYRDKATGRITWVPRPIAVKNFILLDTNPDEAWYTDQIIARTHRSKIQYFGPDHKREAVLKSYYRPEQLDIKPETCNNAVIISSTYANMNLSKTFVQDLSAGKSDV